MKFQENPMKISGGRKERKSWYEKSTTSGLPTLTKFEMATQIHVKYSNIKFFEIYSSGPVVTCEQRHLVKKPIGFFL